MKTLLITALLASLPPQLQASAQDIPYEEFTLDNGLHVIFHVDHDLPLVTVNTLYNYGSLDEWDGGTGYAHLVEHLMFMGTHRLGDENFDDIMEGGGGWNNAYTSEDRTVYYDVGPSTLLPTLLWLEADRLETIGPDMTQQKLDLQREVVRNERRQNYEMAPYAQVWLTVPPLMHAPDHPYAHPVIGTHEDLIATSVEDIQRIYATGYAPANASMVVAGDFDPVATRELVEQLFVDIPGGEPLVRPQPGPPSLSEEQVVTLEDRVELPRVYLLWHSPPWMAAGDADLDLAAAILGAPKVGRLTSALVLDQQIARWVSVSQYSDRLSSKFMIVAEALEGIEPEQLVTAIDAELERFVAEGPTERELTRAVNGWESSFVAGLETLHERAGTLNTYWSATGDPGYIDEDIARYRAATCESVLRVAAEVLGSPRATITVVPGKLEEAPAEDGTDGEAAADEVPHGTTGPTAEPATGTGDETVPEENEQAPLSARDVRPPLEMPAPFTPPEPQAFELSNGLRIWHLPRSTVPAFAALLVVESGAAMDPYGREGLASITADLMDEGAGDLDAAGLADAVQTLGGWMGSWADTEATTVGIWGLSRNSEELFSLMADVALRPTLAGHDFNRLKAQTAGGIAARAQDPAALVSVVGWRQFYGDRHPYAPPSSGYEASLQAIKLKDVKKFYKQNSRPERATLIVVGDVGDRPLAELLEDHFGGWKGKGRAARQRSVPEPAYTRIDGIKLLLVDRPQSPQTQVKIFLPGETAASTNRVENSLANSILGGSFTSRLNGNLREEKGWTYGVHSYPLYYREDGAMLISTSTQAEHTGETLVEIFAEIDGLIADGITDEEANKARLSYLNDQVETFSAIQDIAQALMGLVEDELPADTGSTNAQTASAASTGSISARAAEFLTGDHKLVVLVGDASVIIPQLQAHGFGEPQRCDAEGNILPTP